MKKVFVCYDSDCDVPKKAHEALEKALDGVAEIKPVKCQKICRGPVVGVEVDGTLEWFKKVDSDKARSRLVQLVEGGEVKKSLAKRRVESRSGKKR